MMFWWKAGFWWRAHWGKVLLSALVFLAGFAAVLFFQGNITGLLSKETASPPIDTALFLGDPFDLQEYTQVEVEVLAEGVLFRHECTGIWLAMPYEKTFSIRRGEAGVFDIRPTQHDLMYDILTNYNIKMHYARIERIQHDFFYATVLLEDQDKLLQLDTRPSDALALATRLQAPVYVATKLLKQQGRDICDSKKTTSEP